MKLPLVFAILLSATAVHAADQFEQIKTAKGKTYTKVTVTKVEADGLRIMHESGTAKIAFEDLPQDLLTRYHYDPAKAAIARDEAAARLVQEDAYLASQDAALAQQAPVSVTPASAAASPLKSATPVQPSGSLSNVKLLGKTTSASRDALRNWELSWGSYDQDVYRARVVTVTVQSNQSGDGILELHWIGSPAGQPNNPAVMASETKPFKISAGVPVSQDFATLFVENDAKYVALGVRDRSGYKYVGWVARVVSPNGRTLAVQGSRPPLIALAPAPKVSP